MRPMELIDDLKKKREETLLILQGLQEARQRTLSNLQAEVRNAEAVNKDGLILSEAAISLVSMLKQLSAHIEEGVGFLCAFNEKIGLPYIHLAKEFKKLAEMDKELIAKLSARLA